MPVREKTGIILFELPNLGTNLPGVGMSSLDQAVALARQTYDALLLAREVNPNYRMDWQLRTLQESNIIAKHTLRFAVARVECPHALFIHEEIDNMLDRDRLLWGNGIEGVLGGKYHRWDIQIGRFN